MTRTSLIAAARIAGLVLLGAAAPQFSAAAEAVALPQDATIKQVVPSHVVLILHGVQSDGKGWSRTFKDELNAAAPADGRPEVQLFRWTQPDGSQPTVGQARNSLKNLEDRFPDHPSSEALYQIAVAERLRDYLVGTRALYQEYGVEGRIDIVAHSEGTLIALKALDLGGDADNLVFLGSPLWYMGDRQDDVIGALPHVRGVLYNYYTRNDIAIRGMGGFGLFEPRGWPTKDLPKDKVVQVEVNVKDHYGYYTADAIHANYLDKLGGQANKPCTLSAEKAREFTAKWNKLKAAAGLIDPE